MSSFRARRRVFGAALVGLAMLLAGACGFEPLYRERAGPSAQAPPGLAQVYVEPLADRIGQLVRNALIDRLTPRGEPARPRYRLTVELSERKEGLAIRRDETVTRFNFILEADFRLLDAATSEPVFRGQTRAIAAYNVVRADFATLTAERDAEVRAADEVSHEIRNQIGSYLGRRSGG